MLNRNERQIWLLDQIMNARGTRIDIASVKNALTIIDKETAHLNREVMGLTTGSLTDMNSRPLVMDYFKRQGYPLKRYTKAYVERLSKHPKLPRKLQRLLEIRLQTGKTSTAKYQKLLYIAAGDGRAHGLLQYHAASTGRWGGRLFQPQNLPRPTIDDTDFAIELFQYCDNERIRLMYGENEVMNVMSSCLRGMLIPSEGMRFLVSDYSAIEARVLAWLAEQDDVTEVFRGHGKIYEHVAAGIYGIPMETIKKGSQERFIGKVATLALGYQGAVAAFVGMAEQYGVEISKAEASEIVSNWREANPMIVKLWRKMESCAMSAIQNPGKAFAYNGIRFMMVGEHLMCELPSGRLLNYAFAHTATGRFGNEQPCYMGVDSLTKQWKQIHTYAGKLTENIVQAIARDLIADAAVRIESSGYKTLLTVHDELISEAPMNFGSLEDYDGLMCVLPNWAHGLPLSAEGYESSRYRK